ncbi:NifB/NifX family molybdenum-iron cluster-binding protein [Gracilinema caldarium]|uniref:NifB/NifX family molybdenum-iron cluster-binding protein n=1 Tax=Gracilinema caldarium TaxID=215591 RepID=UPI0026F37BCB|nr:NifB/NifX family molybdenum-iron cluster-binding protein [Gracilinema caldarium]
MKIAFVTDDGKTISKHFGRARFYEVITVENGQVVGREQREKLGHAHFAGTHDHHHEHHDHHGHGGGHGFDTTSQERHNRMAQAIVDCQYLVAGGMGAGAYASLQQAGITPIVTDYSHIDEAVQAHIAGNLKNHTEYLH